MTPLIIRPAQAGDADALTALAWRAKASWNYPLAWLESWRDELAFTPQYLVDERVWVVDVGGVPGGVLALERRAGGWSIDRLWVDPDAQGLGVGRALVDHALAFARTAGGDVDVVSDPHAEGFYIRLGARRAGSVPAPMPTAPDRLLPRLIFGP